MKYAALAVLVAFGDFFLKRHMEKTLEWGEKKEICKGRILLRRYHNSGGALNILDKHPREVTVICGALLLGGGVLGCFLSRNKRAPMLLLGLSLLLGGGASNFYDRVSQGYVVDYFSFQTPFCRLNRIIFNVSDLCIFLGGVLAAVGSGKNA